MRTSKSGQAAIEFAIGVCCLAFILSVLIGYASVYLKNIQLQSEARCDAGIAALGAADGSEALGGAAAFTSRAHPSVAAKATDPWTYPIRNLPDEMRFGEWSGDAVSAGRLIPGGRKKDFYVNFVLDYNVIVDDYGLLSEELYMPAMGGLKTVGGDR
jgi:hypothetical protein